MTLVSAKGQRLLVQERLPEASGAQAEQYFLSYERGHGHRVQPSLRQRRRPRVSSPEPEADPPKEKENQNQRPALAPKALCLLDSSKAVEPRLL